MVSRRSPNSLLCQHGRLPPYARHTLLLTLTSLVIMFFAFGLINKTSSSTKMYCVDSVLRLYPCVDTPFVAYREIFKRTPTWKKVFKASLHQTIKYKSHCFNT
ncbi:hypothetical protein QTP88_000617 [Uroleucon formosanum]